MGKASRPHWHERRLAGAAKCFSARLFRLNFDTVPYLHQARANLIFSQSAHFEVATVKRNF
jgi:hypothetical protein